MDMLKKVIFRNKTKDADGKFVVLEIEDSELYNQIGENDSEVELRVTKITKITFEQRQNIFELITNHTKKIESAPKVTKEQTNKWKEYFYEKFMISQDLKSFSLSNCTTQQASEFINMIKGV